MTRYAPQWLQAGQYAASVDRRLMSALWPNPASAGCAVTVSSGMTVNVALGQVSVPTGNNTGSVLCSSDATEPVTLAAAPGAGNNRYDVVICQARGNDLDGGANNDFVFTTVTGTAAASPTVPATPANAVALAQIYVPGGSASVTAGNITDVRPGGLSPSRGLIAYAQLTTNSAALGATLTEISTALRVSFTQPAIPRRVEVGISGMFLKDATATAAAGFTVVDGGTNVAQQNIQSAGSGWQGFNIRSVLTPSAGLHTYTFSAGSGGGTLTVQAAAGYPTWTYIKDLGAP